jgi:hypothetical protein
LARRKRSAGDYFFLDKKVTNLSASGGKISQRDAFGKGCKRNTKNLWNEAVKRRMS